MATMSGSVSNAIISGCFGSGTSAPAIDNTITFEIFSPPMESVGASAP